MRKTEYQITASISGKIAVVSDLHEYDPGSVLEILRKEQPDLIMIPGDLFENHVYGENLDKYDSSLISKLICCGIHLLEKIVGDRNRDKRDVKKEHSYRLLREASRIAPVYMSLGNHEMFLTEEDLCEIRNNQVHLLDNAFEETTFSALDGSRLWIGGLTSLQTKGTFDRSFLQAFSQEKRGYRILLCHHPEYYPQLQDYQFDLILSGHCHGGQLRIFHHGIFGPGQGLFPKYHHGFYDGHLIVSAGCSNTASIPRWGNETEVVILNLRKDRISG